MQMTKGNVGSLLVFDPSKFTFSGSEENLKVAAKEAVAGLVTERGMWQDPLTRRQREE